MVLLPNILQYCQGPLALLPDNPGIIARQPLYFTRQSWHYCQENLVLLPDNPGNNVIIGSGNNGNLFFKKKEAALNITHNTYTQSVCSIFTRLILCCGYVRDESNTYPDLRIGQKMGYFKFLFFFLYPKKILIIVVKKKEKKPSHSWYEYHPKAGEKKKLKITHVQYSVFNIQNIFFCWVATVSLQFVLLCPNRFAGRHSCLGHRSGRQLGGHGPSVSHSP